MLFPLCLKSCFPFSARKSGNIEVLLDMLLEDFKNFPQVRELGEFIDSSARRWREHGGKAIWQFFQKRRLKTGY